MNTPNQHMNNILKDKFYLADQNVKDYVGTRPTKHFINVRDVLPINTPDKTVLEFATTYNLTIITSDVLFVIQNLLKSKNVIYQNKNKVRLYFTVKTTTQLEKYNILDRILGKIKVVKNKKYIANSKKVLDTLVDTRTIHKDNLTLYRKKITRENLYKFFTTAKTNNAVIVTQSKHITLHTLLKLKECVFVDKNFSAYHISLDYFVFERVEKKHDYSYVSKIERVDSLQDNIKAIRDSLSTIEKNLDYVEFELMKRKELEGKRLPTMLQVPLSNTNKGIDTIE